MPIGKEAATSQASIENAKLYLRHCQLIDEKLQAGARENLPEIPVTIPEKECPGPVAEMIQQAYKTAGWAVEVDREQREKTVIFRFS